jgi:hypothetical protein
MVLGSLVTTLDEKSLLDIKRKLNFFLDIKNFLALYEFYLLNGTTIKSPSKFIKLFVIIE